MEAQPDLGLEVTWSAIAGNDYPGDIIRFDLGEALGNRWPILLGVFQKLDSNPNVRQISGLSMGYEFH